MSATTKSALCAGLSLFFAGYASAQGTFLGQIQVGAAPTEGSGIYSNVSEGATVGFIASGYHCYCCDVRADSGEAKIASVRTEGSSTPISVTARGFDSPGLTKDYGYQNARVCFQADPTIFGATPSAFFQLTLSFSSSPASKVWVECSDTTLIGGFNTMSSNYNFLELVVSGVPSNAIIGTVRLANYENQEAVVPFGLNAVRRDISIHDRFGAPTYGRAMVCHDGAPGSVQASLAEYRIDGNNPASFTLVGRSELKAVK